MKIKGRAWLWLVVWLVMTATGFTAEIIRVGFFQSEGYHMMNAGGARSGYGYDYLQNLNRYLSVNYEYVGYDLPWRDMPGLLERGEIDLLTSAVKTPEREAKFAFSKLPIGYTATILTVRNDDDRYLIRDYRNWNGMRVGMIHGDEQNRKFAAFAARKNFSYTEVYFSSLSEVLAQLREGGRIDAAISGDMRLLNGERVLEAFGPVAFYVMMRRDDPLQERVDRAMENLTLSDPGLMTSLRKKYFSEPTDGPVSFTPEELAFIHDSKRNGRVFTALLNPDRPLLSFPENGETVGLLRDAADTIIAETGLSVCFLRPATRAEYRRMRENGEADLVFDAEEDFTEAERGGMILTRPYVSLTIARLHLASRPDKERSIAMSEEFNILRCIPPVLVKGIRIERYPSVAAVVEAVKNGKNDAAYLSASSAAWAVNGDESNRLVFEVIRGAQVRLAVAVSPRNGENFTSIFSKAVDHLTPAELADIGAKYAKPQGRVFSWRGLFFRYPVQIVGILLATAFGVIALLSGWILLRRRDYRRAEVVRQLPLRYLVADRQGRVLQYLAEGVLSGNSRNGENLEVFLKRTPAAIPPEMKESFTHLFESGEPQYVDYEFQGAKRSAVVMPLAFKVFHAEAAIWISHDTAVLQAERNAAAKAAAHFREQTKLWNAVFDALPVGIFAKDIENELRYILSNKALETCLGKNHAEIIGHTDDEIEEPRVADESRQGDESTMASPDGSFEYMQILESCPGGSIHLKLLKKIFVSENGRRLLLGIASDVTEMVLTMEYQEVMNFSLNTLFQVENIETAARSVVARLGEYTRATRVFIMKYDVPNHRKRVFAEYARAGKELMFADGEDIDYEPRDPWFHKICGDEFVFLDDLATPEAKTELAGFHDLFQSAGTRSLFGSGLLVEGALWGDFALVYEDCCHQLSSREETVFKNTKSLMELLLRRARTQKNLENAVRQAQSAEKAKSFFLASVSHEIRTPLNAVIGFAELLKKGDISREEAESYVEAITFSGNSLLQLINDVLDLSKLEAEQMALVLDSSDFKTLSSDVMKIFSYRAKEKDLRLDLDIPEMPLLELDQMRMRQVLINLVGNAVKFTPRGSITIQADYKDNGDETVSLQFCVIDTGIGIAKADQEKLMQPFVQLSNLRGTNSGNNGTGLGLAISSRLLKVMGGQMFLESEPGKGSRFRAVLPNVRIAPPGKSLNDTVSEAEPPAKLQRSLTLLLVDDVQMNLKVLDAMCRKLGMRCVLATSGFEALEKMERERFDAVLTDMWMPGMSGEQLAVKLREDARFFTLPIIAVTADVEVNKDFMVDHFTAILQKPVTLAKIREILAETVRIE